MSTENGQQYAEASNFPYISHIKLQSLQKLSQNLFISNLDIFLSTKAEKYVFYCSTCNSHNIFLRMFFQILIINHRLKQLFFYYSTTIVLCFGENKFSFVYSKSFQFLKLYCNYRISTTGMLNSTFVDNFFLSKSDMNLPQDNASKNCSFI